MEKKKIQNIIGRKEKQLASKNKRGNVKLFMSGKIQFMHVKKEAGIHTGITWIQIKTSCSLF